MVGDEFVFIFRGFLVAVGGESADKFPFSPLGGKGVPDVQGGFGGETVIHQAVYGDLQAADGLWVEKAVHLRFADRDKPDSVPGKHIFQKIALVRVVSEHPGEVFADYAVDDPVFHVPQHPQKGGPVKIRAAAAVVHVIAEKTVFPHKSRFQIVPDDLFLVGDAHALVVSVVLGKADVGAYVPDPAGGSCFLSHFGFLRKAL